MKKLIAALLVALPAVAFADGIHGVVRDATTGEPVQGVSVFREDTGEVVTTDDTGRYQFDGEGGPVKLIVVSPSYGKAELDYDGVHDANFVLVPLHGEEIVVEAEREHMTIERNLTRDEVMKTPGARNDALLAIKNIPGIQPSSSLGPGSAGLVIRGSSAADSRIFVDGFEIPILYHLGGIQSVIPTEMIEDIGVQPGGFGVELGRASGGVVNVTSRKGARTLSGVAEVSFINSQVMLQGPLGKKGSFAIAGRRSYIDALIPLVVSNSSSLAFTALPRYYDYQARFDYEPAHHWKLSGFLFGSDDVFAISTDSVDTEDPARTGNFSNTTRFTRAILSATYDKPGRYNKLSLSGLTQRVGFDIGADRFLRVKPDSGIVRDEARIVLGGNVALLAGGEAELRDVSVRVKMPRPPKDGEPQTPNFTYDSLVDVTQQVRQTQEAAWVAAELVPVSWWKTTAGVRVDDFRHNDVTVVQPRVQTKVRLDKSTSLLGAAGLYTRPPDNQDENLQASLEPERAVQTQLGIENKVAPGITFTTTAYYIDRSKLIVAASSRDGAMASDGSTTYTNEGTGTSYGAEMLLQARGERFFGWAAYTYARSTRRDHPMDAERLFDNDQSHNLIVLGSVKLGQRKQWQVGGRFQLTTGTPYTPVTGALFDSDRNSYRPEYAAVNSQRNPVQHQLDLRVDRDFVFRDWKLTGYLDVSNVYMNAPIVGYQYNTNYTERKEITGIPILPSFGIRGEF